jgi:hypothetical protein
MMLGDAATPRPMATTKCAEAVKVYAASPEILPKIVFFVHK